MRFTNPRINSISPKSVVLSLPSTLKIATSEFVIGLEIVNFKSLVKKQKLF